jgi:hypothetical protein
VKNILLLDCSCNDNLDSNLKTLELSFPILILMWFKKNGHFAKNNNQESEVSHEYRKNPTTIHSRI